MIERVKGPDGHHDETFVVQEPMNDGFGGRGGGGIAVTSNFAEIERGYVYGDEISSFGNKRPQTDGF